MLRGAPDFYHLRRASRTYPVADLAELAARLGSIVTHDRRGDVIYMERFDDALAHWNTSDDGEGSSVTPAVNARHGGCSIELAVATGMAPYARLDGRFPYPYLTRLGLEFASTIDDDSDYIDWRAIVYDGAVAHTAEIEYHPGTPLLRIRVPGPAWQNLPLTHKLYAADNLFHIVKLVFDVETDMYVRLIIDSIDWDLSAYAVYHATDTVTTPHERVQFENVGDGVNTAEVYIDDVILTQDEP